METFSSIGGVVVTAIVVAILFYFILKIKGPWGSFWTFFLVLLLAIWAASLWVSPMGPVYWGVAWVPLLFIGILVALLLAAIPKRPPRGSTTDAYGDEGNGQNDSGIGIATLSGVFWMFMVILLLAVVIGYTL